MRHVDPPSTILGRIPSPCDLVRAHAYPGCVTMVIPLPKTEGLAVMLLSFKDGYAVIPVAHFNRFGRLLRLPAQETEGLTATSRRDLPFPYQVEMHRPMKTAADPRNLAEEWARTHLDTDWRQACHY